MDFHVVWRVRLFYAFRHICNFAMNTSKSPRRKWFSGNPSIPFIKIEILNTLNYLHTSGAISRIIIAITGRIRNGPTLVGQFCHIQYVDAKFFFKTKGAEVELARYVMFVTPITRPNQPDWGVGPLYPSNMNACTYQSAHSKSKF